MMRSLWTGASGMTAQQMNVDVIANNLSNVNTTGFKRERLEFKSLLYQNLQMADLDPVNMMGTRPVNLQVGLGVRPMATSRIFSQGGLEITNHHLDFAIEGFGFFAVETSQFGTAYTRDGSFAIAATAAGSYLVTSDGHFILGVNGEPIIIPGEISITDLVVDDFGRISARNADGEVEDLGMRLEIVQFPNAQGLSAIGGNLFVPTVASGVALLEIEGTVTRPSRIIQGAREMSNVQVAEEMVRLIVAQRAYELNARAITTSDEMLQQANQLKR